MCPDHTNSTEVTRLLTTSVPSLLGRKQVIHLYLKRHLVYLTFLVSIVLICEHMDLCVSYMVVHSYKSQHLGG